MSDNQVDNRNAPSYLTHYGMHRAPFMANLEDDMYYPEPTRTQRLDILLHLAQYGNELLLVTGPEGSGKTTMLTQFLKKAGTDWKICQVNAHNMLNIEQLLSRISRGFNFPEEKLKPEAALSNLKRRLEALLATHQTVIIIVDNAQQLSVDVLNVLLEFSNIRNISKGISLRVLLFSEPQIKIQLASPELQSKQTLPIRKIDLPAFDEQQTGKLIRHRVTTSGLASKSVFNDAIISKIYKYSEGWPGAIAEIAHQVLFESTPVKRRDSNKPGTTKKSSPSNMLPVFLSIIAIIALAAVIYYQDQINDLFNKPATSGSKTESAVKQEIKALPIPSKPEQVVTTQPIPSPPSEMEFPVIEHLVKQEDQSSPATTSSGEAAVETPGITNGSTATTAEANQHTEMQTQQGVEPEKATSKSPVDRAASVMDQQSAPDSLATAETAATSTPHAANQETDIITLHKQDDWLLAQNPEYFTLQILAGYQSATINKFITQHRLPEDELAYYFSLNRGKDWHSLVFGYYPSRSQAEGAASELARQLPGVKPWIRSIKSIQDDIEYARSRKK